MLTVEVKKDTRTVQMRVIKEKKAVNWSGPGSAEPSHR
jgi:hypothetical protein